MQSIIKNAKRIFSNNSGNSNGGSSLGSFTSYVGQISQSGVGDPTRIDLFNNLADSPIFPTMVYDNTGSYVISISSGAYNINKVFVNITPNSDVGNTQATINYTLDNPAGGEFKILTFDSAGNPTDSILDRASLEIRIYN